MLDCAALNCTIQTLLYLLNSQSCLDQSKIGLPLLNPIAIVDNAEQATENVAAAIEINPAEDQVEYCKCEVNLDPPWFCTDNPSNESPASVKICSKEAFVAANEACQNHGFIYGMCENDFHAADITIGYQHSCKKVICIAQKRGNHIVFTNDTAKKSVVGDCHCIDSNHAFFKLNTPSSLVESVISDTDAPEDYKAFLQDRLNSDKKAWKLIVERYGHLPEETTLSAYQQYLRDRRKFDNFHEIPAKA